MAAQPPPRLNPKDLFEKRMKRDSSRLKAYNQILEQIQSRIYAIAQMNGNANFITYNIPAFIFGLPKIDLKDCVVYVVFQLRQAAFEVKYTYPDLLWISWRHHEKDYLMKQNPIIQAMIPSEKEAKKKASTVKIPKPTAEYTPPASFFQSLEKPEERQKRNVLDDLWAFQ